MRGITALFRCADLIFIGSSFFVFLFVVFVNLVYSFFSLRWLLRLLGFDFMTDGAFCDRDRIAMMRR